MYVQRFFKSYRIFKRQLFTDRQNLNVAELKGPVSKLEEVTATAIARKSQCGLLCLAEQTSAEAVGAGQTSVGAGRLGEGWTTSARDEHISFSIRLRCFFPKKSIVDWPGIQGAV